MPFLISTLLVLGSILLLVLLWASLVYLAQNEQEALSKIGSRALHSVVSVLMLAPLVVVAIVAVLFALVFRTSINVRLPHAFLLLGLWMPATILALLLLILGRLRRPLPTRAFLGFLIAIIPVTYFTPLDRFWNLFEPIGFFLPLMVGLALIGTSYVVLWLSGRYLRES